MSLKMTRQAEIDGAHSGGEGVMIPAFTCRSSPTWNQPDRWIAHDANGNSAGEFPSEREAKECVYNWNAKSGDLVTLEWVAPSEDADESNRGTYIIRLTGTRFRLDICSGWHSQELASERLKHLRNAVAEHGFDAVSEILFAAQTCWTEFGWINAPHKAPTLPMGGGEKSEAKRDLQ